MRMGSQRAQSAQNRLLHLCLDVPVVLHIGGPVHNDFHNGVLVERPGRPERAAQALPLGHPLVRNAVRTAHACMCAQLWSGSCRLGLLHSRQRGHLMKPGARKSTSIS